MATKRAAKPGTAAKPSTAAKTGAVTAKTGAVTAKPGTVTAKVKTVDVRFTLPADVQADKVALCGEFNEWSADNINLERDGDGSWIITVALKPGRSYRFRYLLDGERWENAWQADGYLPNPYGSHDSVILVK
jgi:1,4-alpha-glucan branching enzyme